MKKLVFVFALLSGISYAATAQNTAPQQQQTSEDRQRGMAEHQARTFQKLYNLSDDQYKGIYDVCLGQAKKMDEMRSTGKQPTPQQFDALNVEMDAGFKKVMNADQYAKFESTRRRPSPAPTPAAQPAKK